MATGGHVPYYVVYTTTSTTVDGKDQSAGVPMDTDSHNTQEVAGHSSQITQAMEYPSGPYVAIKNARQKAYKAKDLYGGNSDVSIQESFRSCSDSRRILFNETNNLGTNTNRTSTAQAASLFSG